MFTTLKFGLRLEALYTRPWATEISKIEAQRRMKDWNDAVDRYIDDDENLDYIEIDTEFKIGLHGGPLYRSCEADGCYKSDSFVEGLEEFGIGNMKCCSACRRVRLLSWVATLSEYFSDLLLQ